MAVSWTPVAISAGVTLAIVGIGVAYALGQQSVPAQPVVEVPMVQASALPQAAPPAPRLDVDVHRNATYLRICSRADLHGCSIAYGSPTGARLTTNVPLLRGIDGLNATWAAVRGPGSGANIPEGCQGQTLLAQRLCTYGADHHLSDSEFYACLAERGLERFEGMTNAGAAPFGTTEVRCAEGALVGRLE